MADKNTEKRTAVEAPDTTTVEIPDTNAVEITQTTAEYTKAKVELEALIEKASEAAAKIIEKAKAEAAEIMESATEKTATKEEEPKTAQKDPFWEELVEVYLMKDNGKYKDDVYVAVNGENCIIQRGKKVMIKRKFADVLRNSMEQDAASADLFRGLQESYKEKTDMLNE